MVVYTAKWNILAGKAEAYAAWAQTAIPTLLGVPGLIELRGYRPASGSHQVVVTYEFADMAAWASWYGDEQIKRLFDEAREYTSDYDVEIWGPSSVLPSPIRPNG